MRNVNITGGAGDTTVGATADYKDNLYLAVNGEWLKTAKIPDDKPRTGGFSDLDLEVEKQLMQDFQDFADQKKSIPNDLMKETIKLYQLAMDTKKLDADGAKPMQADIEEIKNIKDIKDLNSKLTELVKNGVPMPFSIDIDADMKDTSKNVVYVYAPSLILPDKTYYIDNPSGEKLLEVYKKTSLNVLNKIGIAEKDAQEIVQGALDFDKSLVPFVKSSEEWADYTKAYNPVEFSEFVKNSTDLDLEKLITNLIQATPEKIIVTEPRYYNAFDEVLADNFENMKSWMLLRTILGGASALSEDLRQAAGEYRLALSGSKELPTRIKSAFHRASGVFSEVVGAYYGNQYFGQAAKKDVIKMIEKMIAIYKKRITDNEWLGEETKKKAIVKLEKIELKVGYPDKIDDIYTKFKITSAADGGTLYGNLNNIAKIIRQDNYDRYKKPVDRTEWNMPGHMVNASYDPSKNDITFPAAILQAPFYSLKQSSSQNYGGIGAVIAHEISHAFDNNGAQFDEFGNLNNWWSDEDFAKFKELTQAMIEEFDGVEYAGGKVNGTLVVSENVADVGGLKCALEAAKTEEDSDLKEFFANWARVWKIKATQQFSELQLSTDVHAPGPLRANIHAQNMDDFYEAFNVTEKDGMWLAPEKRVNIW